MTAVDVDALDAARTAAAEWMRTHLFWGLDPSKAPEAADMLFALPEFVELLAQVCNVDRIANQRAAEELRAAADVLDDQARACDDDDDERGHAAYTWAAEVTRACAERLAGVSLECRDALELITDYGRHPSTLLYCDPPYVGSTRAANYRHEMTSDAQHRELAAALLDCRAAVVLSGYHSPLYEDLYDGWHRAELKAWTGNGIRNGATKTDGDRIEVLWSNRPFPAEDLGLFEVTA